MKLLKQFSIQLYTLRDIINDDFKGTLKKLAGMGYTGVEFAGYGGLTAREMKDELASDNLKPIGAHVGIDRLINNIDEEIEYHKVLGTEYIICPYYAMSSREDALKLSGILGPVSQKIGKAGFKFAYHNHAHEFSESGGEYLLDILFQNLPEEAVMEFDIFWAAHANVDPYAYMEKNRDRIKLIHVKQIDNEKNCVDIEQGVLDFKKIISAAKTYGIEHFILEQEKFAVSSMASVKKNIDYIFGLEE